MSENSAIQKILITYLENIAIKNNYDFIHEKEENEPILGQIVFRDFEGTILATPLSFHFDIDEEAGSGEFTFYNRQGEFKRMQFNIFEQDSLLNVLTFIQNRIDQNVQKDSSKPALN